MYIFLLDNIIKFLCSSRKVLVVKIVFFFVSVLEYLIATYIYLLLLKSRKKQFVLNKCANLHFFLHIK